MTQTVQLLRSPIDLSNDQPTASPSVGIFWGVMSNDVPMILHDSTPVAEAENYDLCKTHPRDHYAMWEASRQRLALVDEYDDHPRGRIVFDGRPGCFVVYLDRQLDVTAFRCAVLHYFALPPVTTMFCHDAHYSRARHKLALGKH